MQDQPSPEEILAAVATFLRDTVVAESKPHTAYQARVAANAVDLVRRQISLAQASDAAETERLQKLLGRDGSLESLNVELADALAEGRLTLDTPGLHQHLIASTLEKLAVDQPNYSGYRAALAFKDA